MKGKYDHAPLPGYEIEKRLHATIYAMLALFARCRNAYLVMRYIIYIVSLYLDNIELLFIPSLLMNT